ncbi:hypothetical protein Taro_023194 [Colocasia esculenta]|uniref:Uncharacterized protein n=1 Tax=Colocasia esculenta TaxID=4460 RepID=A0A843V3L1_COLES|nr:hypothetical protein [Colocasia esculenta]
MQKRGVVGAAAYQRGGTNCCLLDPTAVHWLTQFSDLTPEEFEPGYLRLHHRLPPMFSKKAAGVGSAHEAPMLPTDDLLADFDWKDHGAITPVKN